MNLNKLWMNWRTIFCSRYNDSYNVYWHRKPINWAYLWYHLKQMFWAHLCMGNYAKLNYAAKVFFSFMTYRVDMSRENIVTKTLDRELKRLGYTSHY